MNFHSALLRTELVIYNSQESMWQKCLKMHDYGDISNITQYHKLICNGSRMDAAQNYSVLILCQGLWPHFLKTCLLTSLSRNNSYLKTSLQCTFTCFPF